LKNEAVLLVKMDATANDVPSTFDVRGFPTLYWLPKNGKNKPIRYEVFINFFYLTVYQINIIVFLIFFF